MGSRRLYRVIACCGIIFILSVLYSAKQPPVLIADDAILESHLHAEKLIVNVTETAGDGPLNDKSIQLIDDFFDARKKTYNFSELGQYLFVNFDKPQQRPNTYKILIWQGSYLQNRHEKYFGKTRHDPFELCSARNCLITNNREDISEADAVVFHLQRMKSPSELPTENRLLHQRWIFLSDESPKNTFMMAASTIWPRFNGIFNWSMTYRMESDVPVPYGRTVKVPMEVLKQRQKIPLPHLIPNFEKKKRDVLVAIAMSNCHGFPLRTKYVEELQKYIEVDFYGKCGNKKEECPGHFRKDCDAYEKYLFYLSFENTRCDQYITEKVYHNAMSKGAIPIVLGPTRSNVKQLLPPKSYLHVDDFARPGDLAAYIKFLNSSGEFMDMHEWRRLFDVGDESGYFQTQSWHYCRVCEALNYNDERRKVYVNLSRFLNKTESCLD